MKNISIALFLLGTGLSAAATEFQFKPLPPRREIAILKGNTFEERATAAMKQFSAIKLPDKSIDLKYVAPYAYARLQSGTDIKEANRVISQAFDHALERIDAIKNKSERDFYSHSAMQGYFAANQNLSAENKVKTKKLIESFDLTSFRGTINMSCMLATAALLGAEEWPDLKDVKGNTQAKIHKAAKAHLMKMLRTFFFDNNFEMDAFTYLGCDAMFIRTLAEYARDKEVKQAAQVMYQKLIASLIPAWNNGAYIACPYRSKGWNNMLTNFHNMQAVSILGWIFLNTPTGEIYSIDSLRAARASLPTTLYYLSYPGEFKFNRKIAEIEKSRNYPYIYRSYSKDNDAKYYKYGYQSNNYGLASMLVKHNDLKNADKRYGYKEIKRNYLNWKSNTPDSVFSVCQDNPGRPRDMVNRNDFGYGENPFHRVFQHENTMIGIYNVPESYIGGKRYQIYVPFTKRGIVKRVEADGWILCHTGSMMFAFRTLEPYVWNKFDSPKGLPRNYDVLSLLDTSCRKGAWILECTEITPELQGSNVNEELGKFKQLILKKAKISTRNYDSSRPSVTFVNTAGVNMEITYFPPTEAYKGQYKLNGKSITPDNEYLLYSPYVRQKRNSPVVELLANDKVIDKIVWP